MTGRSLKNGEHPGETDGDMADASISGLRAPEYASGYLVDHYAKKGHIALFEGEFVSELQTGETHVLTVNNLGGCFRISRSHRSRTKNGVKLLIIDGDFLQLKPA